MAGLKSLNRVRDQIALTEVLLSSRWSLSLWFVPTSSFPLNSAFLLTQLSWLRYKKIPQVKQALRLLIAALGVLIHLFTRLFHLLHQFRMARPFDAFFFGLIEELRVKVMTALFV